MWKEPKSPWIGYEKSHEYLKIQQVYEKSHICEKSQKGYELIMKRTMHIKGAKNAMNWLWTEPQMWKESWIYEQESCSYIHGIFYIHGSFPNQFIAFWLFGENDSTVYWPPYMYFTAEGMIMKEQWILKESKSYELIMKRAMNVKRAIEYMNKVIWD